MKKNYVGIREARINLSKLIRDVRNGMEIVITDRGNPVARLVPADNKTLSLEERIKNYESCGLIESCPEKKIIHPSPVELPSKDIQSYIREDRNDD